MLSTPNHRSPRGATFQYPITFMCSITPMFPLDVVNAKPDPRDIAQCPSSFVPPGAGKQSHEAEGPSPRLRRSSHYIPPSIPHNEEVPFWEPIFPASSGHGWPGDDIACIHQPYPDQFDVTDSKNGTLIGNLEELNAGNPIPAAPPRPRRSSLRITIPERDLPPLPPANENLPTMQPPKPMGVSFFVEGPFEENPRPHKKDHHVNRRHKEPSIKLPIPQEWTITTPVVDPTHPASGTKEINTIAVNKPPPRKNRSKSGNTHSSEGSHDISSPVPGLPSLSDRIIRNITRSATTLTSLEIKPSIGIDTCRLLISRAKALRTLIVNLGSAKPSEEQFYDKSMPTSQLNHLDIRTTVHPQALLTTLRLPLLDTLFLRATHGKFSREQPFGIRELLENSKCQLKSLRLLDLYQMESEIVSCLSHKACTTLQFLTIQTSITPRVPETYRRRGITSVTVGALAKPGDGSLCRDLRWLDITDCDVSSEEFIQMVQTRIGLGLTCLEYSFRRPGAHIVEIERQLNALVARHGHQFSFRHSQFQIITKDVDVNSEIRTAGKV